MRPHRLRERFAARQPAFGGWMSINSPYAAEVMGHAGFDTVVVDLQHGPLYLDAAVPHAIVPVARGRAQVLSVRYEGAAPRAAEPPSRGRRSTKA